MSDILGRICFSKAPFHWVKRAFFHRFVLWTVGGALAVGLPLARVGVALDWGALGALGAALSIPFLLWTALLAVVSFVLIVPRLVLFGLVIAGLCFGLAGLSKRLAEWAAKYEEVQNQSPQPDQMAQTPEQLSVAPKPKARGFWSKYGCLVQILIFLIAPQVLAIPVWLVASPESYDWSVDCTKDAIVVLAFIGTAAVFGTAVVRSRKTVRPIVYLFAVIELGVAFLTGWNFVALYTKAGIGPVIIFGWEYSAQPSFYGLLYLGTLLWAVCVWLWLGKRKQK